MPRRSASTGPVNRTGSPAIATAPRVGARWPDKSLMRVDLPAPFSPITAWTSPALNDSETSLSTSTAPKLMVRPRASSTGAVSSSDPAEPAATASSPASRAEHPGPVVGRAALGRRLGPEMSDRMPLTVKP